MATITYNDALLSTMQSRVFVPNPVALHAGGALRADSRLPELRRREMRPGNDGKVYESGELPGGMSHIALHQAGAVNASARETLFRSRDGLSPADRADIVRPMLPYGITVCLWLAAWIWVGGEFPTALDVVAPTHYLSDAYNRALRLHNRTVMGRDVVTLRRLRVASPLRTACDIACLDAEDAECSARRAVVATLMAECTLAPQTCIHALQNNPHTAGHPGGVRLFRDMRTEEEKLIRIHRNRTKTAPTHPVSMVHPVVTVHAAGASRTATEHTEQAKADQSGMKPNGVRQASAAQNATAQSSTARSGTAKGSTAKDSTAKGNR